MTGGDRGRFERHLARCEQCAQEVRELRVATARLATATAAAPPAGLTERVLAVAAILTARDATMMTARVSAGGTATIVMSHRDRELVFAAAGLRALPPSRCYELWLMGPGGDAPAGMLPDPVRGMAGPVIASGLKAGERLGLTVEPAGGSPHPTSAMILVLAL